MSDKRLYITVQVIARDTEGNVKQKETIHDAGSFTVRDIQQNALMNGFDELEVIPLEVEMRDGDETEMKIEAEDNQATI